MNLPFQRSGNDTRDSWLTGVTLAIAEVLGHSSGRTGAAVQPSAFLGADLGLSSLAVARLAGILQKRSGRKPLPFYKLFVKPDGAMLHDIRVSDLVAFLEHHQKASAS